MAGVRAAWRRLAACGRRLLVVVEHEELGVGGHCEFGPDANAISKGHEVAVAIGLVEGIEKPSHKMLSAVPGIGTLQGRQAVKAERLTRNPLDMTIPLRHKPCSAKKISISFRSGYTSRYIFQGA